MRYENVVSGLFASRPNRFTAAVLLDGREEMVHVKNTGRCRELLVPGAEVWLSRAANPNRKTRYDLIAVRKSTGALFNLDSQAPNQLYERFLLNYFRRHHPGLHPSSAEVGASRADLPDFVPALLTDVTLSNGSQTLIVDAKCYGHVFSSHYEHRIVAPANINQIFHYVLAAADERPGQRVSGMLLYAKTADEDIESGAWVEHGHSFEVKLLDLNQRFDRIAADLDEIAETYLTSNR